MKVRKEDAKYIHEGKMKGVEGIMQRFYNKHPPLNPSLPSPHKEERGKWRARKRKKNSQ